MDVTQIASIIGTAASLVCTLVVGALAFFIKRTLNDLVAADKKNEAQIAKLEEKVADLKADLPLIYVTREDYIRIMNRVEDKLDKLLYSGNSKGKED